MSTNPFYVVTEDNPNEIFGSRACSFAGQQKSADCSGAWRTWHSVPIGRSAPRLTVCDYHLQQAANDGHAAPVEADLHNDAGVLPGGGVFVPTKCKPARVKLRDDEELSL